MKSAGQPSGQGRLRLRPWAAVLLCLIAGLWWPLPAAHGESPKPQAPQDSQHPAARREAAARKKQELLKTIAELKSAEEAAAYLTSRDEDIRRAAVARLGVLGDDRAVALLVETFGKEPRRTGIDATVGLRKNILAALGIAGSPKARDEIRRIIETWIKEGPLWKGPYAHLYDSQYQNVLRLAMEALEAYPVPATLDFLRSLNANSSLFYGLREQAWRSALVVEMKEKGLAKAADQVAFLLTRLEPEGAFIENWWEKPGLKRPAAIRESAVESVLAGLGGAAVPHVREFLDRTPPREHAGRTAAASVLATILGRGGWESAPPLSPEQEKEALDATLAYLEEMPGDKVSSPTASMIYDEVYAAAEKIDDRAVWERMKRVASRIPRPDAWQGPAPGAKELGISLPEGAVFIESLSTVVETPLGRLVMARFFSDQEADKVEAWFEKVTRKKSRPAVSLSLAHPDERCQLFETLKTPKELAGFIDLGVTVCSDNAGYVEKAFGEIRRTGRTLIKVNSIRP